MSSGSSKDIYRSQARRRSPLDEPRPSLREEAEWFRRSSGVRWSTAFFLLIILLFLGLLVAVVFYQQRQIQAARRTPPLPSRGAAPAVTVAAGTHSRAEFDPAGSLVLDEWIDGDPAPVGDGPYPLNARWVQEAALHLRRADNAYRTGDWRAALEHYDSAARILPGVEGIAIPRALSHLRLREFEQAEALLVGERQRTEGSAGLLNNLAVARMGQGQYEEAEQDLVAAIGRDPEYLPARHNLALLYYRTGALDPAADAFEEAYRREPLSTELVHLYALTLLKLERWDAAARILSDSIRLHPLAAPIRFRLAEALAHSDRTEAAIEALREAVALVDARNAMRWINRSAFDPLRREPEFEQLVHELTAALP